MHVHVQSPDGEVKIWLEPEMELAPTSLVPRMSIES
ncbi:MAG: hypothetical protein WD942_09495 [Dehalococcoidia bacterium]